MVEGFKKLSQEFQRLGRNGSDAALSSYGEVNKGFQAVAASVADWPKRAFEDATRAFEQLSGAQSIAEVIEIQSQYAQKAFDTYVAQMSKLTDIYVCMSRDAYKPVEQAFAKNGALSPT